MKIEPHLGSVLLCKLQKQYNRKSMSYASELISQDLERQARTRRVMILVAFVLIAASIALAYLQFTYVSSKIHEADKYFSEYRNAKALEILLAAKRKYNHKNDDLDFMLIYAFVHSDRFAEAEKLASQLSAVPARYKDRFIKLVKIACYHERSKLISSLIQRASKLDLDPEFFIETSKTRDSVESELDILESAYNYIHTEQHSSDTDARLTRIENYLLRRYLEIANIHLGKQAYSKAIVLLEKASKLRVAKTSPLKSELHYSLGLAYRHSGNYRKAIEHISESADLGNGRARVMISDINYETAPKVEAAAEEKSSRGAAHQRKPETKPEPAVNAEQ